MQQKESNVGGRAFHSLLLFFPEQLKGSSTHLSNIIVHYLTSFYPVLSYSVPDPCELKRALAHTNVRSGSQQARKACNGECLWVVMQPKYTTTPAPNVII